MKDWILLCQPVAYVVSILLHLSAAWLLIVSEMVLGAQELGSIRYKVWRVMCPVCAKARVVMVNGQLQRGGNGRPHMDMASLFSGFTLRSCSCGKRLLILSNSTSRIPNIIIIIIIITMTIISIIIIIIHDCDFDHDCVFDFTAYVLSVYSSNKRGKGKVGVRGKVRQVLSYSRPSKT